MGPLSINAILSLVEVAITEEPKIAEAIKQLITSNATPEDWAAMRAKIAAMDYDTLVPNSTIPKQ